MRKAQLVRLVGIGGAAISAIAYVTFVLVGLNGGGARFELLWKTVVFAPPHVIVAWVIFGACGGTAYVFRQELGYRSILVGGALVGLPAVWVVGLFSYYAESVPEWPGFNGEVWRWTVNLAYAEFAFGFLIGFLGLAALGASGATSPAFPTTDAARGPSAEGKQEENR